MLLPLVLSWVMALQEPSQAPDLSNTHVLADQQDPKHQKEIQSDIELGTKYAEQIAKELKFSKDQEKIDRIQRIGQQLAAVAQKTTVKVSWGDKRLNPFTYRFFVVEDKDVNAFSVPGGFIYVNEGLIDFAESDDELAGVLAHEIAHAALRHLATLRREQSKLDVFTIPAILVALLGGGKGGVETATGIQLFSIAKASGWSVKAEQAADYAGLQYMVKSSYNPTGILTFMERLARKDSLGPAGVLDLGIYRSHPPGPERASALFKAMKEANVPVQRSAVTTTFRTIVEHNDLGNPEIWFAKKKIYTFTGPDAETRAENAANRLNQFFDAMPEMYELTIKSDGTVMGKGKTLFRILPEDATGLKSDLGSLRSSTELALKRSVSVVTLFSLAR
jgi:predicted Zn-dependent protease